MYQSIKSLDESKIIANEKQSPFKLSYLIASLILSLITIPSFQAIFGYRLLRYEALFFIFWLFIIFSESPGELSRLIRYRLVDLVLYGYWCAIILLYAWFVPDALGLNATMGIFSELLSDILSISICFVIGIFYASHNNRQTNKWIIKFLFIIVGLNAALSLPYLLSSDLAVRSIINSYQYIDVGQINLSRLALGSLGFYSFEALFSPLFFMIFIEAKGLAKYLYFGMFCLIVSNIILSTLLLVQISFVIGFMLLFLQKMSQRGMSLRIRFGILVSLVIIIFIGYRLSETYSAQYSLNRLPTLFGERSDTRIAGDTFEARKILYSASIDSFLKHPVLGLGFAKFIGINLSGQWIGGHSGFLDALAFYGFLPCSFLIIIFWIKYRDLQKMSKYDDHVSPLFVCFLIYLFNILFDPLLFTGSVTGLFFFAVIGYVVPYQRTDKLRKHLPIP